MELTWFNRVMKNIFSNIFGVPFAVIALSLLHISQGKLAGATEVKTTLPPRVDVLRGMATSYLKKGSLSIKRLKELTHP
jgi:hypothetical protein